MKNRELFEKTVGILADAYNNKTLQAMDCAACAVGNMIAACNGYAVELDVLSLVWSGCSIQPNVWLIELDRWRRKPYSGHAVYDPEGAVLLNSTGYTYAELDKIEETFERVMDQPYAEHDQRYGLEAVYEVLLEIHEAEDMQFVRAAAFTPVMVEVYEE